MSEATFQEGSVFGQVIKNEHEQVVFCYDKASGLKAIIAVHNTVLGPAAGGTRMWMYKNEADALNDVLRLSRGMTLKNSVAGINLGGGKAVIIGNSRVDKSEALFRSFGKYVNSLAGKYITAEDVGIGTSDMEYVAMETEHVSGLPESMGGGGDPSPVTAYGVYLGMKASAKKAYGSDSLEGKKVSVQGVGHVGEHLVDMLTKENAKVYISDINEDSLKRVADKSGATVVSKEDIYDLNVDVYAPCALGATVNDDTLGRLKCDIIAGAANNQLKDETIHADVCKNKNIIYAPDFLINSGGIINVYYEIIKSYNRDRAFAHTEKIYDTTSELLKKAEEENINSHEAAVRIALKRIEDVGRLKMTF